MSKTRFVHLHVHTEYSLLDGLSNIAKLVGRIKEMGMDSVAMTDHGALYGAIEFYKAARKEGIKPIIGLEAYTANQDHKLKKESGRKVENNHLLLLAKDEEGYRNLMKLTTIAHLEGYYYRPRFDKETLKKYSGGLICTSACALGEIAQALSGNEYDKARKIAEWFQSVFGEDYFLEVQRHEFGRFIDKAESREIKEELTEMARNEKLVNDGVVKLSRELGIPIVATNDSHYIDPDDAEAQDVLVCVATGKQVSDIKRIRFVDSPTFYIRSPKEMEELFPDLPDAISNTGKVAEKCNLEINTMGKWFFPEFSLPNHSSPGEYLREIAYERLPEKISNPNKETKERLEHELKIIIDKGYAPYFLIVMDVANWVSQKGIITNTRGSAAGSLVSYVLGITTVNPLSYNLPFERFLNPYRPSPPDIDFDVADDRREEIIQYIVDKYGQEKVAQVCTFGRMLARAAVRDVARVLGYPYAVGDRISKVTPPPRQGFPIDVPTALETSLELKQMYEGDPDAKRILDLAHKVEGSARHVSVHAAGIVVAPTKLTDFTPLQLEPSGDKVITQYEMHACEDVGLIKFDILGIRNLSILGAAIDIVKRTRRVKIDAGKIPLDDKKTFEMLGRGETMGVFQLGGSGMTRYLKDLKPTRVEDLMAMVALYRPGPMSVIPEYIARKNNSKLVKYLDPRMEKFLDKSYGLIVYQDDLLFCAIELAGYTWEETDKFRKAVGKKIPAEMAAQKAKFIAGVVENGQTQKFAEKLWDLFEPFQAYGFNKAHAASYGIVAYQTAYMKANYPVEYMCALLTAESGNTEKVAEGVGESKRMGITILPPDINKSDIGFKIVEDKKSLDQRAIRFGLSAIKNVGEAAIEAILAARQKREFSSLTDFCGKVDSQKVNKKVLESLIKAGAMDIFGKRAALLTVLDEIRGKGNVKGKHSEGQTALFEEPKGKGSATTPVDNLPEVPEFSRDELLSLERELLGFYLTEHPLSNVLEDIKEVITNKIFEISVDEHVGQKVKIGGIVANRRVVVTKNGGREMAFVTLEDDTGTIELVVFPTIFAETRGYWMGNQALIIEGKVDNREDSLSLIVDSVATIEQSQESKSKSKSKDVEQSVILRIPRGTDPKRLVTLNQLLQTNKGERMVKIIVENGFGEKVISLPYGISWSQSLEREIRNLLA
ncbi:MAG: DNA polymerase III subunit alpha [Candidatus Blackburnbacteria bacterium]|nr:DNA polymerase III subunit alpha [Candidatus Blackburnbacteria bacterium]